MKARKLPSGVQTFSEVRKEYVYVDKTQRIYEMINFCKVAFLSRPRRFGKSLTCSTLEAIFKNERELFKGLQIESSDWEWKEYPVIRFSFSGANYTEGVEALKNKINTYIDVCLNEYGVSIEKIDIANDFFKLIKELHRKVGKVVIIIDEYDKAILDTLDYPQAHKEILPKLKSFYEVLKDCDEYLKFVFITGVTKFSQISLFSGMNQPEDISFNPDFSDICGITQEELERDFAPEIEKYQERYGGKAKYLSKLKKYYNGYHFSESEISVYNPISLIKHFIDNGRFTPYWVSTGATSFLAKYIEKQPKLIVDIEKTEVYPEDFAKYDSDTLTLIPLLYQAGYLTIAKYIPAKNKYLLKYPNGEVRSSFAKFLSEKFGSGGKITGIDVRNKLIDALWDGKVDDFIECLRSYLQGFKFDLIVRINEHYFEFAIVNILEMLGINCEVEAHDATGSVDAVIKVGDFIYVMEYKLDKPVEEAIEQIEKKNYALQYENSGYEIVKVGISFSREKRNIEEWKVV